MALGVFGEFKSAGIAVPPPHIVGVNAIPRAIDAVADGRMLATAD
jgi:ABC-type sugar transport system substrate-binding protein